MLRSNLSKQFHSLLIPPVQQNRRLYPCEPLLLSLSSFFTTLPTRTYTSTRNLNSKDSLLADYLTNSIEFPRNEAVAVSNHLPSTDTTQKPEAVVCYLKSIGLSITQLQSSIKRRPQLLCTDVEKTIKPKVAFYEELGVFGARLGILISRNPSLFASSLDKKLKPSIGVLKKVLELHGSKKSNDDINDIIFRILTRYGWVIPKDSRLESNIAYLQSCGVVGSQLIRLLKSELRLFSISPGELKNLVSRAVEMGWQIGSRMLVHGIMALYSNSGETINRKYEVLQSFGFTGEEWNEMLKKSPALLNYSEAKLRRGVVFFVDTVMLDKSVLVGVPIILGFSMEKRVIPRYKILEMIKSRCLLEKETSFVGVLFLTDKQFVEKYIMRFTDDAKELQIAYENLLSKSCEDKDKSKL
ncbi:hypothetical protein OROGR_003646 [Orobanche gracilis]